MPTVGQALVNLLAQYGVDTVFGIPGTHSIELYRGLEQAKIRHILPRHEQGGGFMADGYARATGKPGVCFVITGPGVTNLATSMGEAYMDSVPLLVISPVNPADARKCNRGRLHEITDQAAVTAPFTAFSATVNRAGQIPELIGRAYTVFLSERPRPVHINIPLNIIGETVEQNWQPLPLSGPPQASYEQLEQAATMINQARQPLIIAGGGCRFAAAAVTRLAEKAGVPVTTTVAGRGVIAASHALAVGAQLRAEAVKQLAIEADLLIVLGSELAQTDHWDDDFPARLSQHQIRVNLDADNLLASSQCLAIKADVASVVDRLASLVKPAAAGRILRAKACIARIKSNLANNLTEKERLHLKVMRAIMPVLPDACTVVSDMTQLAYTAIDFIPMEKPNRWLHPTGYGTLGYALPAGMGVCIAKPAQAVLVMVGDAGLQYTLQEMTLAAELGLNITVLLWNNDALAQIRDDMVAARIKPLAVTQLNPDFIGLAQACGWSSVSVDDVDTLAGQLELALKPTRRPVLIQLNEHKLRP